MKKLFTLLMAGLMVFSMAACSDDSATTTPAGDPAATTTKPTTTPGKTTPKPYEDPDKDPNAPDDWTILEATTDWHFKLFNCPFNRDAEVQFDPATDEMAQWFAEKGEEWYKDEAILADMKTWPTQTAPMGDRYDGLGENGSPIGWANDTHGIICYQTVTLTAEQIEWLTYCDETSVYMDIWYDNAFYIYINGTLVFSDDANGGDGDWVDTMGPVDFEVDVSKLFVEGENDIVVTLKDCWGGREFIMGIECIY